MKILNKLVEAKIINAIDGESFLIGEDFLKELQVEIGNRYCIADNCIDVPADGIQKGTIPYIFSVKDKTGATDGELDVEVKVTNYEISRMFGFVPVNATIEKMNPIAFRSFLTKLLAKELVLRLNTKAYSKIKACCETVIGAYNEDDFIDAICTKALTGKGIILANPKMINEIARLSDILKLFDINVVPVDGISGVVVGDLDCLYYVHTGEKTISVHDNFTKNMKSVYLEEYNDFAISHPQAFKIFEFV